MAASRTTRRAWEPASSFQQRKNPFPQLLRVSVGRVQKQVALLPGISPEELSDVLKSSFALDQNVVAVEDEEGLIYPLSLLGVDPSYFQAKAGSFRLLLEYNTDDEAEYARGEAEAYAYEDDEHAYRREASDEEYSEVGSVPDEKDIDDMKDQRLLKWLQEHTAFSRLPMNEIMDVFRQAASGGVIDEDSFERAFQVLMRRTAGNVRRGPGSDDATDVRTVAAIADRLFRLFDRDGNGYVDFAEFVTGLSLLCQASSEDKIKAAFSLFDVNGDGFISMEEMVRYLTSFFDVCFALEPQMKARFGGATAQEVGEATAAHCFRRADLNGDGHISFDEFKEWYASDDIVANSNIVPH